MFAGCGSSVAGLCVLPAVLPRTVWSMNVMGIKIPCKYEGASIFLEVGEHGVNVASESVKVF